MKTERKHAGGGIDAPGERATAQAQHALRRAHEELFPARFRQLTMLGMALIASFFALDLIYPWPAHVRLTAPGFLLLRALWFAGYLALLLSARIGQTDRRLQELRDFALVVYTAVFLGIVCACTGRLDSPYYTGVILLVLVRCVLLPGVLWRVVQVCVVMLVSWLFVTLLWPAALPPPGPLGGVAVTHLVFVVEALGVGLLGAYLSDRLTLQLEAAKLLGRYRLGRLIGVGGIGEVYEAQHAALRRRCAVKVLKKEFCDPESVARFVREAEAASRLSHPNTIAVFDVGCTEAGQPYYVMERLEGSDLRKLVKAEGPLPPERAVHLLVQAARSLGEAHRLGMVHRDVKPANLFITTLGGQADFVKVLDFGMVKGVDLGPALTRAGTVMGTPRYIAPEMYTGGDTTPRVDVYALGVVAYYMLCGRPPFYSSDAQHDVRRQVREAAPPLLDLRAGNQIALPAPSAELLRVIACCVDRQPERRYLDAAVLALALEATPEHGRWQPPQGIPSPAAPSATSMGNSLPREQAALADLVWGQKR